ncbi:MAG: hypothetical protein M1820_003892 [Bogoriella megaspora]|nr:MAG: hypothetical protein M1820_003892 [Bogoriella megaspora]
MPDVLWPVFCTTELSTKILNELLHTSILEDPDHRNVLRFLGPDDIGPTATGHEDVNAASQAPICKSPDTFDGWSVNDIYAFWKQYVRAKDSVVENRYTAFTFLICDLQTTIDKTVLLCSDAPDWGEAPNIIELKTVRMGFKDACIDCASFEYLSMTPSEWGKGKGLICDPNPWMKVVGMEGGQQVLMFSTPAFARTQKRRALMDAAENGTLDMTKPWDGPLEPSGQGGPPLVFPTQQTEA